MQAQQQLPQDGGQPNPPGALEEYIEHGPSFAWVRVLLKPRQKVDAEAGAMIYHTPGVEMTTRLNAPRKGGFFAKILAFFSAILRKFLGGETMFLNEFSSEAGGEVVFAPKMVGHIHKLSLAPGKAYYVQAGSYLASEPTVQTRMRWGGLRTFLGREGVVLFQCYGTGDLFINAYGGIEPVEVDGSYIVDTGHLVAFEHSLDFKIRGAGSGLKGLMFSGEGLVFEFKGKGTIWIQSRNVSALVGWLSPLV
ncbi:MAG: TIGR00266 family protein [Myxococcales bacterium]|nr:TIGR00266 family protein [Myxococcales bacterium]